MADDHVNTTQVDSSPFELLEFVVWLSDGIGLWARVLERGDVLLQGL